MSDAWVEETNNKLLPTVEKVFSDAADAAKQAEDDMLDDTANMLRVKAKMYDDDRKEFEKSEEDKRKAAAETTAENLATLQAFYEKSSAVRAENAERLRQQMEAEIERINQQLEQVAGIMSSAFLSGFEDIIRGTKSVAEAFGAMVAQIMYDVGRMLASEALTGLFRDLLKGLFGTSGGRDISNAGVQAGSLDMPSYAPSTGGGRTGVTINVNGARDATAVAREVRTAILNLASTDSSVRRRLQLS
jgi:Skp family chaperone for outer membrane proteins